MRLTQYADFSLRVLMYLAINRAIDRHERSTIGEIAAAYGISRNHAMKVVQRLVAKGYVVSYRGAGGGIRLRDRPDEVRLGRVVRDMEPDCGLVECFRPEDQCRITPACRLPWVLDKALNAFWEVLDDYTLADLLAGPARTEVAVLLKIRNAPARAEN